MHNMKKQILILLILPLFLLIGCTNDKKETKNIIDIVKEQTNISIPQEANLIEKYEKHALIRGMSPSYYVFQFDQEPEEFLLNYGFQEKRKGIDVYDQLMIDDFEEYIIYHLKAENETYKLKIPEESLITFDELYLFIFKEWNYLLVYYPNDYKLIVYIMPY